MSILMDHLKINKEIISNYANPTGFTVADILSANLLNDENSIPVINGGLFPRLINVVGTSSTGKTTFVIQMIGGAIDHIEHTHKKKGVCEFYMYDVEQNFSLSRIGEINNWNDEQLIERVHYKDDVDGALEMFNDIRKIVDTKEKLKKHLSYTSNIKDLSGQYPTLYYPTFILLDSVASFNPTGVEDISHKNDGTIKNVDKLATNMHGAQSAKELLNFIRKAKPYFRKYNIVFIMINHTIKEIQTDLYTQPTRHLPFLAKGEKLKGGNEMSYQSFMILKIAATSQKLDERDPKYGENIRGMITNMSWVKNKNNIEGIQFPMVFDQRTGYHSELSNFEYLLNNGNFGITGSPMAYRLQLFPEISFTKKQLYSLCQEEPFITRVLSLTVKILMTSRYLIHIPITDLNSFSSIDIKQRVYFILNNTNPSPGYYNIEKERLCCSEKMMKLLKGEIIEEKIFKNVQTVTPDIVEEYDFLNKEFDGDQPIIGERKTIDSDIVYKDEDIEYV